MRFDSTCLVLALAASSFVCGGCRKGVLPNDESMMNSPEGKACPPAEGMIENCEDNNNQIMVQAGRGGYMYTFVDKEGSTVSPLSGEAGGIFECSAGGAQNSKYGLRMTGSIGTAEIVFAGMGLNLTEPKGPYDASKYGGIAFWAKKGPGSTAKVRMKVPDKNTDPEGGICGECFNDFGIDLTFSDEWQYFVVPWYKMSQQKGWGSPKVSEIDKSTIYGIQFQVNDKGRNFDIWIDDLQFTGCGG